MCPAASKVCVHAYARAHGMCVVCEQRVGGNCMCPAFIRRSPKIFLLVVLKPVYLLDRCLVMECKEGWKS